MANHNVVIAKFPGVCLVCHQEIEVGDSIVMDDEEIWIHSSCSDDEVEDDDDR